MTIFLSYPALAGKGDEKKETDNFGLIFWLVNQCKLGAQQAGQAKPA